MDPDSIRIERLGNKDLVSFDLLLLADDEMAAIEKYIYQSEIYVARSVAKENIVGIIALHRLNDHQLEIKALAVEPLLQNTGIGKLLIYRAIETATEQGFAELHVGTADCATKEIRFYERRGFSRFAVKTDFFLNNYSKPLFENGVRLRDMVMLRMYLSANSKGKIASRH